MCLHRSPHGKYPQSMARPPSQAEPTLQQLHKTNTGSQKDSYSALGYWIFAFACNQLQIVFYINRTSYYNCLNSIHDKCFNIIQTFHNSTTCAVSVIYIYRKIDYGHTLFKVRQTELTQRQKRAPYYKKHFHLFIHILFP